MFNAFDHEDSALEEEIARVYTHLTAFSAEDEEYQKAVDQLSKLYKLKHDAATLNLQAQKDHASHLLECDKNAWQEEQEQRLWLRRVDPGTVVTVAGNLAIALIVIKYEERSVISTKALSFMKKF